MTDYDSAPSEVGGALGKDSEMLKTVIESRTRPYIDLMNELSGTGIEKDLPIPQTGHQFHEKSWKIEDSICIVVSHSGGTFGPLAVSNLLQGFTRNLFVITSEWDTQIGKQLRQLKSTMFESRIFSTNLGVRPAEPCSVSVAATQQLLTHLLEYSAQQILASPVLRHTAVVLFRAKTLQK